VPAAFEQLHDQLAIELDVFSDEDALLARASSAGLSADLAARGRRNQKREPPTGRVSAPIVPPQRSTVILQK